MLRRCCQSLTGQTDDDDGENFPSPKMEKHQDRWPQVFELLKDLKFPNDDAVMTTGMFHVGFSAD